MKQDKRERSTPAGTFWASVPVILIVSMFVGLGTMAYIAVNDPSFAVEKDYYKKAVNWDETQAQNGENSRLGWNVALEVRPANEKLELVATLTDRQGQRIRDAKVEVEAFANARAARIVTAHFEGQTDGTQRAALPLSQPGLWEFRFTVEARGEHFTQIVRHDVRFGDAS